MNEALVELTADIVAAYVSHNPIPVSDMPLLIKSVHASFEMLGTSDEVEDVPLVPAVSIRASVKPDYLVCLEDGKKMKLLKGHLNRAHGMSPIQYRKKWNLPADYPMVAPAYAAKRRSLAIEIGLGRSRAAATLTSAPAASKRGAKVAVAAPAKPSRQAKSGKLSLRLPKGGGGAST